MAQREFDRKFGAEFMQSLPDCPGVYLVYDANDALIYVGKAKHLRRRLSQYRNAVRRKKHRRMRAIVKNAARIEIQSKETDLDACLAETTLIQTHRPRWNIVGAYSFLYPQIGIRTHDGNIDFCLTTLPDDVSKEVPGFEFHGSFRSRRITGDAFFALMRLLKFVGHVNSRDRKRKLPQHSYLFSFRKLPPHSAEQWAAFYKGESASALEELVLKLVDSAAARRARVKVQEHLNELKRFWKREALTLARAREVTRSVEWPIPQLQRDLIFLAYKAGRQTV